MNTAPVAARGNTPLPKGWRLVRLGEISPLTPPTRTDQIG